MRHASALIGLRSGRVGGTDRRCNMSSVHCAGSWRIERQTKGVDVSLLPAAAAGKVVRLSAIVLGGALLAACAQSSFTDRHYASHRSSQYASLQPDQTSSSHTYRRVARRHTPFAHHRTAGAAPTATHGVASFYTEGTQTASGEKFNTHDLTAAHPSLPFGTRLRVTNVATGRSVTVRVNDRGPYVRGRVVDVSYSAAESLGMVGKGVANVKLDVVQ
jgi:rare lipoprotein A